MTEMESYKFDESNNPKGLTLEAQEAYREEIRSLVEHITRLLVDQPETVTVTTYVGPKTTVYRVNCAKENLGQVIGSQGKTIMGLRAVVHAMTARTGIRSIVEIPV
ncbi:KH domain-containing protein [Bdellovibrio bacteriovorus]|uniref:RNA-binding protein KhpA n=1 Tax=Bdellovibrio bacteriovorus TaxID=959 RepID=A0A162G8P7_BDEBC|nr:KH domain-containing protein [Bdellovibrio bacteriovorus]KYG65293.1 KH domain-containing protein [Bdellovibrio bacteriovorus]